MKLDEFELMRRKKDRDRTIKHLQMLTGESRRTVVTRALEERLARLTLPVTPVERTQRVLNILERSIWGLLTPRDDHKLVERAEEDRILGYGPEGV